MAAGTEVEKVKKIKFKTKQIKIDNIKFFLFILTSFFLIKVTKIKFLYHSDGIKHCTKTATIESGVFYYAGYILKIMNITF